MTTKTDIEKAHALWQGANDRFEYFVLTLATGLCAWAVQTMQLKAGGLPAWFQSVGIAVLAFSVATGLIRLQYIVHIYGLSFQQAKAADAVSKARKQECENYAIGAPINLRVIETAEQASKSLLDEIGRHRSKGMREYKVRNWSLALGLGIYAVGRVLFELALPT